MLVIFSFLTLHPSWCIGIFFAAYFHYLIFISIHLSYAGNLVQSLALKHDVMCRQMFHAVCVRDLYRSYNEKKTF